MTKVDVSPDKETPVRVATPPEKFLVLPGGNVDSRPKNGAKFTPLIDHVRTDVPSLSPVLQVYSTRAPGHTTLPGGGEVLVN